LTYQLTKAINAANFKEMNTINKYNIATFAERLLSEMGGDALEICTGDCATFAKKTQDQFGGVIKYTPSFELLDEINGRAQEESTEFLRRDPSHCWVEIDGVFFDAFDTDGVEDENYLQFVEKV